MPKIKEINAPSILEERNYMWGAGEKTVYLFACLVFNTHFLYFVHMNSQDLKKKNIKKFKSTIELI